MRERINLLPRELYRPPEVPFNLFFYASGGALILILGVMFFTQDRTFRALLREKNELNARLSGLTSKSSVFKQFTDTMQGLQAEQQALESQLSRVRGFFDARAYFSDVLRELTFLVPEGLSLTELRFGSEKEGGPRTFVALGRARYNHAVAGFILALEKSRAFRNIFLNYSREIQSGGASAIEFEITAEVVQ